MWLNPAASAWTAERARVGAAAAHMALRAPSPGLRAALPGWGAAARRGGQACCLRHVSVNWCVSSPAAHLLSREITRTFHSQRPRAALTVHDAHVNRSGALSQRRAPPSRSPFRLQAPDQMVKLFILVPMSRHSLSFTQIYFDVLLCTGGQVCGQNSCFLPGPGTAMQ